MENLVLIFRGVSPEHTISILSAYNIASSIDVKSYRLILVYITKDGSWRHIPEKQLLKEHLEQQSDTFLELAIRRSKGKSCIYYVKSQEIICYPNIVFPILHGKNGEDGVIQGILKSFDLPFTGPGILGTAISIDKSIAKETAKGLGIQVAKEIKISKSDGETPNFLDVIKHLGIPFIVKPARAGSSFGVSKVNTEKQYKEAIMTAFLHDSKIVLEEYIAGREIECAILGNHTIRTSSVGEITYSSDFYSFEAKYKNKESQIHIPAKIPEKMTIEVQICAKKIYKALHCHGFSRVDFFITDQGELIFNELNAIPGFTNRSMFPLLWQYDGITQSELINQIIQLGIEAFNENLS